MNLFYVLAVLSLLLCNTIIGAQQADKRPNIIFILTDDQDVRMHSLSHMPKVQKHLMEEGTTYTRHYASTALCCPARVSILTGLYAHNHLVTDVSGQNGGWKQVLASGLNSNYLPIWLRDGGHRTTGKLYNGMSKDLVETKTARGWTEAHLLVGGNTYQYYDPPFQHIQGNWDNPAKIKIFHNNYTTEKVAEYAYGYLKEAATHDEPFFQVGKNPGPPVPSRKHNGTRPNATVPRADNFNPVHRSGVNVVWSLDRLDGKVDMLDHHYECRTEALLSVDDLVEHVIKMLEDQNQLNNTFIIYTSDNGFHLGHHRLGPGKKFAFEEDINVPLIIRGPGVPKNLTTDIVSAHIDLAPTILKMANVSQRADFDGKPIPYTSEDIQREKGSGADEHTNVEFWTGATFKMNGLKGRRVNSYKSVRLVGTGYDIMYAVQCHNNSHELYNMNKDPVQMHNLHPTAPVEPGQKNAYDSGEKKLAGYDIKRVLPRLDALFLVLKSCKRSSCSKPWQHLHPEGDVNNLRDAMAKQFDDKYHKLPKLKTRPLNHKFIRYYRCELDSLLVQHDHFGK
ncbi:arylsulfatase [Xylogone sp. PMI_703]|nr:arylsulfatase [Xylogone sp. PMI_703]